MLPLALWSQDVSIQCGSAEHSQAKAVAWFAIILYPIGLIVVVTSLLIAARKAITTHTSTPLSRSLAFLHREFKPERFYWWEVVEMLRSAAVDSDHQSLVQHKAQRIRY